MAQLKITKGPTREMLFKSYMKHFESRPERISFITENDEKITGVVQDLEFEDGSGQSFNIDVVFSDGTLRSGYYNTRRCRGFIEV